MAPPGRLSKAGSTASPNPPIKPIRPNTRSVQTANPSIRDLISPPDQEVVQDAESGRHFLQEKGFIEADEPMTPEKLSKALVTASQYKGLAAVPRSVLTAAAYIIREMVFSAQADEIVSKVTTSLQNSVISAISPQIAKVLEASEKLTLLDVKLLETQNKIEESAKIALASHQTNASSAPNLLLEADLATIKTAVTDLKDLVTSTGSLTPPAHSPYRDAVLSQQKPTATANQAAESARASAARKERQLLIDIALDHPAVSNHLFSRLELISLFQKALTSIKEGDAPDLQLRSLLVLRNGGILLEFPSKQAVKWLKENDRLQKLADATGGKLTFKDRSYNIVVPFVPTSTLIEESEILRSIEVENELPTGSIGVARWIKPPRHREAGQRVAHALFRLTTPEAANKLINKGMYINLERFRPTKDKKEPLRCLKCQLWGHMAKDCKETRDTCGTCAKNHRTNTCPSYKTVYCVSCSSEHHASWSRTCPEFQRRSRTLDESTPENLMPYFPTDEPWTQANLPPKPTSQLVPTPKPSQPRRNASVKTNTQGHLSDHFRPKHQAHNTDPTPNRPGSPTQHSTPTPPLSTTPPVPPVPHPQQQQPNADLPDHSPSQPGSMQESEPSRSTTPAPIPRAPAAFPPISPLSNPPPMPTPPPYLGTSTTDDSLPPSPVHE